MSNNSGTKIFKVRDRADLDTTIRLFRDYTTWLGVDLTFQDFANEMTSMPGKYAPPKGELLLARDATGAALGCVALRPLPHHGPQVCEMKRLYVVPAGRGKRVGVHLANAAIEIGTQIGYREMRLDTLPHMESALALYKKLGFREIEPYYQTPLEGTVFLSLHLPTC